MNQTNYEFPSYKPGVVCKKIGLHWRPHEEECAAIAFLKHHGEKLHPGISSVIENEEFIFFDAGPNLPYGQTWQEMHKKGIVLIGVGGSPYDEHVLPMEIGKTECAATLVARALQIDKGPEYQQLLQMLLKADRNKGTSILNNSYILNCAHKLYSQTVTGMRNVVTMVMANIECIMVCQQKLFRETKVEFEKKARVFTEIYRGQPVTIVSVASDDEQISSYAQIVVKPQMTIIKRSNGHVFISASKRISLGPIVRKIRMAELELRGERFDPKDVALYTNGQYHGLEEWHFQEEANKLMNGSLTAPRKRATELSFGEIVRIVQIVLRNSQLSSLKGNGENNIEAKVAG